MNEKELTVTSPYAILKRSINKVLVKSVFLCKLYQDLTATNVSGNTLELQLN